MKEGMDNQGYNEGRPDSGKCDWFYNNQNIRQIYF